MSILKSIDKFSYSTIVSAGFLLAICFAIPVSILVVQQQTKISSSAKIEKPTVIPRLITDYGQPASSPIEVSRVYPFLGKSGDELIILGKNLGTNPKDKQISIGGVVIEENDLTVWQDNMITLLLPDNARSGYIDIRSGQFNWRSPYPFTIYSQQTQTQVRKTDNILTIISTNANITKASYNILGSKPVIVPVVLTNGNASFEVPGGEIDHLALYDSGNNLVSFFVNPIEFDF